MKPTGVLVLVRTPGRAERQLVLVSREMPITPPNAELRGASVNHGGNSADFLLEVGKHPKLSPHMARKLVSRSIFHESRQNPRSQAKQADILDCRVATELEVCAGGRPFDRTSLNIQRRFAGAEWEPSFHPPSHTHTPKKCNYMGLARTTK